MHLQRRTCPLCNCPAISSAYPYSITYAGRVFNHYLCGDCSTVFVDPLPDASVLHQMYEKSIYHDIHYSELDLMPYRDSVSLLSQYARPGSVLLDFGCGVGHFLRAAQDEGFIVQGVEFDESAAAYASSYACCSVSSVSHFNSFGPSQVYDIITLLDVLEHIPDPSPCLRKLLCCLQPGGLLFLEGPLEANPSPVFWSSRLFGKLKRLINPFSLGSGVPNHLFRTSAKAQKRFFCEHFPDLELLSWRVYDTGWPYADAKGLKLLIAIIAKSVGGKQCFGFCFGNRFQAILKFNPTTQSLIPKP